MQIAILLIITLISGLGIFAFFAIESNNHMEQELAEYNRLNSFPVCNGAKQSEYRKKIAIADYSKIHTGMAYWEIYEILGNESSCDENKDKSVRVYLWRNPDTSYVRVTLKHNSAIAKEQSGLK